MVCRSFFKVCNKLKNCSRDVRAVARDTLFKTAHSLGPHYLQLTVKELRKSLTRGYQVREIVKFCNLIKKIISFIYWHTLSITCCPHSETTEETWTQA